jgi:hypothetical protein
MELSKLIPRPQKELFGALKRAAGSRLQRVLFYLLEFFATICANVRQCSASVR